MSTTGIKTKLWANDEKTGFQERGIAISEEINTELWTKDEETVFQELGIAAADVKQRLLVRGIRRAIGRLVAANIEIVKALREPGSGDLAQAQIWLEQVAGDEPPRCEDPTR